MSYNEAVVLQKTDLANGDMTQVSVADTDVLLVRREDRFYAYQANCTHYGAPLAQGALSGDRIVCPWHHACFRASSGYQLEPPGLDSLEAYEVRIEGEDVIVRVPEEPEMRRIVPMSRREKSDTRTFVVLGGGAAGEYAVEALREKGFGGRVVMITREAETPYDRPNCSKEYLQGEAPEEWMFLRGDDFYKQRDIERMHGRIVAKLDASAKRLEFEDGEKLDFDGIIICTGGIPRTLDVPGIDLEGVFTLRSYQNSKTILTAGKKASRAVVVGASFIGMEVAWSLKELGLQEVTVVSPEEVPFARPFGERVGQMIKTIHEENGVVFRLGHSVKEFRGDRKLQQVVVDDGTVIDADIAVIGIGVRPATAFVEGLSKADDGAVIVDDRLRAAEGIYAAGDIANFPDWRTDRRIRVEHWRLACQHGRVAGYNLAGEDTPYRSIPYFWTAHFGTSIRYVGHASTWDEIIYDGAPEERAFIAFYVENGVVLAAAGSNRDKDIAAIEELMRRDLMPSIGELGRGGIDFPALLQQV